MLARTSDKAEELDLLLKQDVLRFEVAMDQMGLIQKAQSIQQLLREDTHESRAEASELILLDELVEVDTE